jgi:hypothetical protein
MKEVTVDDVIGMYYFQYFRVVKEKFISKDGKHYNKAKNDPVQLLAFTKATSFINEHKIDYIDYISDTFEHYKKFLNPKVLINLGNITRYKQVIEERTDAKNITTIYDQILKSIRFVALQCKMMEMENTTDFMRHCIHNDLLGKYLMSGKLSKYYLAMFSNIDKLSRMLKEDSMNEIQRVVVKHRESINIDARNAIKMFNGSDNVSIIAITNYNINKLINE